MFSIIQPDDFKKFVRIPVLFQPEQVPLLIVSNLLKAIAAINFYLSIRFRSSVNDFLTSNLVAPRTPTKF